MTDDKNKKILSRDEFRTLLNEEAAKMNRDASLSGEAKKVLSDADHYHWVHQTSWMGEPILNLPQDMFAMQEIIYRTRPDFIVESGVAWGGSLLFYSTLMEILGGKLIIGIDVFIPDDLKERIGSHEKLSKRIRWINDSSTSEETLSKVKEIVGDSRKVLVFLDSDHTHEHVLTELNLYAPLIGKGQYIICGDTIVEDVPEQKHRPRAWGPGNNPKTALMSFLDQNDRFEVDQNLENKLLFTCNPGGYLKCIKD